MTVKLASHRRWIAWGGVLGALTLLGGCVATGPVGYDDYPYDPYYGPAVVGPGHVDLDVYSYPRYRYAPGVPYYGPGYRHDPRWRDPRWRDGYRGQPPRVVPVPVPVPVPQARPPILRPAPGQPAIRPAPNPSPFSRGRGLMQGGEPTAPGNAP